MTSCTICVAAIEEDIAALPCRHVFHTECIKQWFSQKTSCPNCNKKFHRNSVIGPLYLDDPKALKATSTTNNRSNEVDQGELTLLREQLTILQRSARELQQKVTYLKSIRSVDQLDSFTQTPEAQARIRQWQQLDNEYLANLVEITSSKHREAERKLQNANNDVTTIQHRLTLCQDEKKFFEKKFNKLKDKLQSVQKSKLSRTSNISKMYNEAGPSSSNVLGSSKGTSSRKATSFTQTSSNTKTQPSSTVDSDVSTDDEISAGSRTVPKKRSRTGSSNRNSNGFGPYSLFNFNRPIAQTEQHKESDASRNQEPREIKRTESEIEELELSDTDDYTENDTNIVVLQPRVIDEDSDSETDDGGGTGFDEGFSISTNRGRSQHHARFRSPSPPVIEISDEDI